MYRVQEDMFTTSLHVLLLQAMADSSENGSLGKRQRNKGKAFYNKTSGKKYMVGSRTTSMLV